MDYNGNNNSFDVTNSNLLDDNFSNASGCGIPPVCTEKKIVRGSIRSCKKVLGKQICINKPTLKTVVNQSCIDSKARYKACINDPNRKKLLDKVKSTVKKTTTDIKKGVSQAKKDIKKATTKAKTNIKKKVTNLKDKVGQLGKNFRNKFRSVMRKGILFNIKNNIHGTASRLYPAVASDNEVASRKYKKSFVNKSRNMYSEVVSKWKSIGGNEDDLKNAIRSGHSKGFLKAPYKSANGDDSYALYLHYTPSNLVYWENPNDTFYFGADGEEVATDETVPVDETAPEEEVPAKEEEVKGIRAFFAWLKGLFGKHKADDENPYAEGTPEYEQYMAEHSADAGNEPDPSEANDPDIQDVMNKGTEDGAGTTDDENAGDETDGDGSDDTILGMEKNTAIGVGIGVVALLAIGGYFLYKKYGKSN